MQAAKNYILDSTQQICDLYRNNVNIDEAVELMRRQNISAELVKSVYIQLSKEVSKLMTERFHYYTIKRKQFLPRYNIYYWTSRYLLTYCEKSTNPTLHEIKIDDLFHNKSTKVTVKKSANLLNKIYPLNDDFGLLEERTNESSFISLICLDLYCSCLQKLHTVEYPNHYFVIFVNKADPTTFIVNDRHPRQQFIQMCKVVKERVIVGEKFEFKVDMCPTFFHNKCVYQLIQIQQHNSDNLKTIKIEMYNVERKTKNEFELEAPIGYGIDLSGPSYREIVDDNLFVHLISRNNTHFIGCLNVQTRKWNVLDFYLTSPILSTVSFNQGSLVVCTMDYSFYKIPFGKPDSLENTAWFSLVKAMKKRDGVGNPYEAAKKFLLPNSDINCPFNK